MFARGGGGAKAEARARQKTPVTRFARAAAFACGQSILPAHAGPFQGEGPGGSRERFLGSWKIRQVVDLDPLPLVAGPEGKEVMSMDFRDKAEQACLEWNRTNPIGTCVEYYPTPRSTPGLYFTRSSAYVAPNNCAVIFLKDKAGFVMLSSCKAIR